MNELPRDVWMIIKKFWFDESVRNTNAKLDEWRRKHKEKLALHKLKNVWLERSSVKECWKRNYRGVDLGCLSIFDGKIFSIRYECTQQHKYITYAIRSPDSLDEETFAKLEKGCGIRKRCFCGYKSKIIKRID